MEVIIGSDCMSKSLREEIVIFLSEEGHNITELTQENLDFVDCTLLVSDYLKEHEGALGIVIDSYGVGPFIVASKIKGLIAANVSDERSAYMTRLHNNSRLLSIGSMIVGKQLAKSIVKNFVNGKYEGGRHQIRVDMLNKMC